MSASRRLSTLSHDPIVTRHQRFIRSLPCLSCGRPAPSECAYVGMIAGLGIRDRWLVPLCGPATVWQDCCHSRKHFLAAGRFWSELGIDLPGELARQLWRVSGDVPAGLRVVRRARQAATAARQHRGRSEAKASSPRSAVNGSAALRARWRPTVIVTSASRSEFPVLLASEL